MEKKKRRSSGLRVVNRVTQNPVSRKSISPKNIHSAQVQRDHKDRRFNILLDGPSNDFVDHLSRITSASPITTACLREKRLFVQGKGFMNELGDQMVNPRQNLRQLHELLVSDYITFGRIAVKIIPDRAGRKAELYHIPVEWVRWNIQEDTQEVTNVVVNPFFNTPDEKVDKNKYYPIYYPGIENDFTQAKAREFEESLGKDIKQEYEGHIMFYNSPNPHNRHYSRPDYYSSEDWMVVDYRIGQFHERNTANNFLLGGILHIPGNSDDPIYDEDGQAISTLGDEAEAKLREWFSGTGEAGSIMLAFFQNPENKWEFEPFDVGNSYKVVEGLTKDVTTIVSMVHGVPETLLQNTAGKLGSSSEINDARKLLSERTADDRELMERLETDLLTDLVNFNLPEEGVKIKALEITSEMPSEVYNSMSVEAKNIHIEKEYGIEEAITEAETEEISNEIDPISKKDADYFKRVVHWLAERDKKFREDGSDNDTNS